jgi:hypothetical protein
LFDVDGNAGAVAPEQIENEVPKLKEGITLGSTVTLNVTGRAHEPAVGVNVYVAEF